MKTLLLVLLCALLAGCSSANSFLDDPGSILKDPHFAEYQRKEVNLERSYLHGQIDYAEFLERKKQLDEDYARDVQSRDAIIRGE